MESKGRCTGTKVTLVNGEEFLIVEIALGCPICGPITLKLAGHHLRMVRDMMIEMIDLHPTLTGQDSDVKTLERLQFAKRLGAGEAPENN